MQNNRTPYYVPTAAITIASTTREHLLTEPKALFPIGRAPDGLPILLYVNRAVNVRRPVIQALSRFGRLPPEVEKALEKLDAVAQAHTVQSRVHKLERKTFFETSATVRSLFGQTLFSRMLGPVSPMVLPEDHQIPGSSEDFENSVVFNLQDLAGAGQESVSDSRTQSGPGNTARLWLALDSDEIRVASPSDKSGPPPLEHARTLIWESLLALRSARFTVRYENGQSIREGRISDQADYRKALFDARSLGWSVARAEIGQLLIELARGVDRDWHEKRRVHADLKPGNVLLHRDGVCAFDPIDVPVGTPAVGLTAGWAAPEQLIGQPVTPAADVFALALMTVSLLDAAIYGEEHTLVVPARGEGRRRIRVITDPEVWVDPTVIALSVEGRVAWREFLMRCLAKDPGRRPARGLVFAEQLENLLARWELPGRKTLSCGPGQLDILHGRAKEHVWVLEDRM